MKHLMMTVVTVLTLGVTMTMVKADTYQSGRDAISCEKEDRFGIILSLRERLN